MSDLSIWLAVSLGGATGAILRGLIYRGVEHWSPGERAGRLSEFGSARSTLLVNTLGSFLLGIVLGILAHSTPELGSAVSAFWVTGLCGAVTTFSTLCADAIEFARRGDRTRVAIVLLANTILSIAALLLGLAMSNSQVTA